MKTRKGFVSNSSSSSFVLKVANYGGIDDVAHHMLDIVIEDYSSWHEVPKKKDNETYVVWTNNLEMALRKRSIKSGKIGIVIPSCNYDTYIIQKDNTIYVDTCNNHNWALGDFDYYDADPKRYPIVESLKNIMDNGMFFDIQHNFIHSKEKYDLDCQKKETCPHCKDMIFSYVVNQKGKKICGVCYKGDLGNTPEKEIEKLKDLKEKTQKNQGITTYMSLDE